jgi:hypothetical protein
MLRKSLQRVRVLWGMCTCRILLYIYGRRIGWEKNEKCRYAKRIARRGIATKLGSRERVRTSGNVDE